MPQRPLYEELLRQEKLNRIPKVVITPSEFVKSLPDVHHDDLPDDVHDRKCMICHEDLETAALDRESSDQPVQLPCGHILGKDCVLAFTSAYANIDPKCPLCRTPLARFGTPETNPSVFLLWIARNDRGIGSALDRRYQASAAIHEARALCFSFPQWNDVQNGSMDSLDLRYLETLEVMAALDPVDRVTDRKVDDMQDQLDEIFREYMADPGRPVPPRPSLGRNLGLGIRTTRDTAKSFEVGPAFGGLSKELSRALRYSDENVAEIPGWVCRSLNHDFAGVPERQIGWEICSRRFAHVVSHNMLPKTLLYELAANMTGNEEIMKRYAEAYKVYDAKPRRERHWVCVDLKFLEIREDDYY